MLEVWCLAEYRAGTRTDGCPKLKVFLGLVGEEGAEHSVSEQDELDYDHLRNFLDRRVRDGVIRRAIGKWLQAGVLEEGSVKDPAFGTYLGQSVGDRKHPISSTR